MKRVVIPNTDLAVSNICYGAAYCAFEDEKKYFNCLDCFIDRGGSFLDTANIYGKWLPHGTNSNEIMLGKWMRDRKNRDKITIATKAAHPELSAMHIHRMSYNEIVSDLNESLSALDTDYADILWLHRDAENLSVGDILDILSRVYETGKVRYFGCSNWKPERLTQAIAYAKTKGIKGFIANQPQWSLAEPNNFYERDITAYRMDKQGVELHIQTGLAAVPYTSQAVGFFARYSKSGVSESLLKIYDNDANMRIYNNMRILSEKTGYTYTQISLAYLISHDFLTIPIIGSKTPEQINESVSAADIRLGKEELELLTG